MPPTRKQSRLSSESAASSRTKKSRSSDESAASSVARRPEVGADGRVDLDKENARLQRKLAQYEAQAAKKTTDDEKKPAAKITALVPTKSLTHQEVDSEEFNSIVKAIALYVFTSTIFLPAGGRIWAKIMEKIYQALDPRPSTFVGDVTEWIHSRGNVTGGAFNQVRQYTNGRHKDSVKEYADQHNGSFPPLAKIKAIANRTIKIFLNDDEKDKPAIVAQVAENVELFKWYWDTLMGRCCPSGTKFWDHNVKYYKLLSAEDSPITPQMEAFVVANFTNNYSYWKNWYKINRRHPRVRVYKKPKGFDFPPLPEGQEEEGWRFVTLPPKGKTKARTVIYYQGEDWETLYSKSDAGSSVSGGWTSEGKKLFVSWVTKVVAGRNTPQCRAMEEHIFTLLRQEHGIEADDAGIEEMVRRRHVAAEEEGIDWAAGIGIDLSDNEGQEELQDHNNDGHDLDENGSDHGQDDYDPSDGEGPYSDDDGMEPV